MSKNKVTKPRDETCTHEAVQLVRDTFRFCPSRYWRDAIILTAGQDMPLWKDVIRIWARPYWKDGKKKHKNPMDWKHMLSEFDRRYFDNKNGIR